MSHNIEQLFDNTVKKVLPYLILSPPDFRNKLAENMDSLFHFYQGGDSSITTFLQCNDAILEMLKDPQVSFDSTTHRRIERFGSIYKSFDERISDHEAKLAELSEAIKELKKSKKSRKDKVIPAPVIVVQPAPVAVEPVPMPVVTTVQSRADTPVQGAPIVDMLKIMRRKRLTPSEREQKLELIRNYLRTNGEIDNPKAREICGLDVSQAKYYLHKLVEEKFVEQKGERSRTKYVLK